MLYDYIASNFEKDTIQTMILFELAKSDLPFVFKGGIAIVAKSDVFKYKKERE